MRRACLRAIHEMARRDPRIFFIGSDLGHGTLREFQEELPERYLMEGVCESGIVGLAAGLALEGKIPYVNTIASFATRRPFEHIVLDLCLHRARVRLVGNGGGLVYAPLGPTHMAVEDIAIMRVLPHMAVAAPADAMEMAQLAPLTVEVDGPVYIRLAKGFDPVVSADGPPLEYGRGRIFATGSDALLVSTGITLGLVREAAARLAAEGVAAAVLHLPFVAPLDKERLLDLAAQTACVVTVEEHVRTGGLGSAVAEVLCEAGLPRALRFARVALPDAFPDDYGSQAELMARYGLTAETVVTTARRLLAA